MNLDFRLYYREQIFAHFLQVSLWYLTYATSVEQLVYSTYNSKLLKNVILYAIWGGKNTQSTTFCSLAGGGLVYGCYKIHSENAETICYVTRKVLGNILFSVN